MDALQVATALNVGSDRLLTNDKKLKGITELEIVVVADL